LPGGKRPLERGRKSKRGGEGGGRFRGFVLNGALVARRRRPRGLLSFFFLLSLFPLSNLSAQNQDNDLNKTTTKKTPGASAAALPCVPALAGPASTPVRCSERPGMGQNARNDKIIAQEEAAAKGIRNRKAPSSSKKRGGGGKASFTKERGRGQNQDEFSVPSTPIAAASPASSSPASPGTPAPAIPSPPSPSPSLKRKRGSSGAEEVTSSSPPSTPFSAPSPFPSPAARDAALAKLLLAFAAAAAAEEACEALEKAAAAAAAGSAAAAMEPEAFPLSSAPPSGGAPSASPSKEEVDNNDDDERKAKKSRSASPSLAVPVAAASTPAAAAARTTPKTPTPTSAPAALPTWTSPRKQARVDYAAQNYGRARAAATASSGPLAAALKLGIFELTAAPELYALKNKRKMAQPKPARFDLF